MTYLFKMFHIVLLIYLSHISVFGQCSYSTKYINLPVDHFGYTTNDTFSLRYVLNRRFFESGGPIFFYTGNEGDIELFAANTGLVWEWQMEFKAMIIFAEHRYYGKSMPYGNQSYATQAKAGYLTAEQALADFVEVIHVVKSTQTGASNSPVVAFGGSYGGMLTAWLRMKYPASVVGGLAASAPIWQFEGLVDPGLFNVIVTKNYLNASQSCSDNIRRSWTVINNMFKAGNKESLRKSLRLCSAPKSNSPGGLKGWLSEIYTNLAMINYPYPANFLEDLPAWPVQVACHSLNSPLYNNELLQGIGELLNVYFNKSGKVKCFKTDSSAVGALSDDGWDYQSCNEMVMPMSTNGVDDMFEPSPWDLKATVKQCARKYGLITRPYWINRQFGGKHIEATNIIFSNGDLDPWSAGGVTTDIGGSLTTIIIENGAHHLDLRSSNRDDPPSVIEARNREKLIIRGWIENYQQNSIVKKKMSIKHPSWFSIGELLSNPGMFIILVLIISCCGTIAFIRSTKKDQIKKSNYIATKA